MDDRKPILLRPPAETVETIDQRRGATHRTTWIIDLLTQTTGQPDGQPLIVNLPPDVADQLQQAATRLHRPPATLALGWITDGLARRSEARKELAESFANIDTHRAAVEDMLAADRPTATWGDENMWDELADARAGSDQHQALVADHVKNQAAWQAEHAHEDPVESTVPWYPGRGTAPRFDPTRPHQSGSDSPESATEVEPAGPSAKDGSNDPRTHDDLAGDVGSWGDQVSAAVTPAPPPKPVPSRPARDRSRDQVVPILKGKTR